MSTLKSPAYICLPAHILDANVSPRAREVLMLLASQTTAENPMVWVCQGAVAERLRCSAVTVKRAIQNLVEAKLIVETGDLHERRYKFYRVKWSLNSKGVVTPAKAGVQSKNGKDWMPASAGMTKPRPKPAPVKVEEPRFTQIEHPELMEKPKRMTEKELLKPTEHTPPSHPGVNNLAMLKDSRIAYWAEVARQKHEENLRRYRMEAEELSRTNPEEFGGVKERLDNPRR